VSSIFWIAVWQSEVDCCEFGKVWEGLCPRTYKVEIEAL
jgi:hypothetical protein